MFARAIPLALLFGLSASLSCSAAPNRPEPEQAEKTKRKRTVDKDAVSEKGKKWGGWRWKGKRDNCFFVTNNRCFDNEKAACKAAKCGSKACLKKSGAPTKISCPEKSE